MFVQLDYFKSYVTIKNVDFMFEKIVEFPLDKLQKMSTNSNEFPTEFTICYFIWKRAVLMGPGEVSSIK